MVQFIPSLDKQKFVLTETIIEIRKNHIDFRIENVILDYVFEDFKLTARFICTQSQLDEYLMKRILNEKLKMRSFYQSSSLKAELEFKKYTRFYFVINFFSKSVFQCRYLLSSMDLDFIGITIVF